MSFLCRSVCCGIFKNKNILILCSALLSLPSEKYSVHSDIISVSMSPSMSGSPLCWVFIHSICLHVLIFDLHSVQPFFTARRVLLCVESPSMLHLPQRWDRDVNTKSPHYLRRTRRSSTRPCWQDGRWPCLWRWWRWEQMARWTTCPMPWGVARWMRMWSRWVEPKHAHVFIVLSLCPVLYDMLSIPDHHLD